MVEWPTISLIIPNYNCGKYLEHTILSVINQNYPALELIMVDGDSTDGSKEIIEKYKSSFTHTIIEKDTGQANALNKGFRLASGGIMGWINSDDILLPGSLHKVAQVFEQHLNIGWIVGNTSLINQEGDETLSVPPRTHTRVRFIAGDFRWVQQESTFWRRDTWEAAGSYIDESYKLAVDAELWLRFFKYERLYPVEARIGAFRTREGQRSENMDEYYGEAFRAIRDNLSQSSEKFTDYFKPVIDHPLKVRTREEANNLAKRVRDLDVKPLFEQPEGSGIFINPNGKLEPSIPRVRRKSVGKFVDLYNILYTPVDRNGATDLTKFKDNHIGERCVIMGNGPSLNKMDLSVFSDEIVFAANSIFLLFDRVSWRPAYYSCVDTRVLPDIAPEIQEMRKSNPDISLFFPKILSIYDGKGTKIDGRSVIPPADNTYFFNQKNMDRDYLPHSAFSLDADRFLCTPNTVTITLMQLAYYMGFAEIYLIGCDTSYSIPKSVAQDGPDTGDGTKLFLTSTEDDDVNHFDPRYFGKGKKWHSPKVADMIFHYYQAAVMLEECGTKVFNATVGGNLEVYQRVDYKEVFR